MTVNDENPRRSEILSVSRENTAESESQLLGTRSDSEVPEETKDDSDVKVEIVVQNQSYKTRVLLTVWIFWSFVALGLMSSEIGPSFLDLLSLTNSSLAKGSVVITSGSAGYLTGAVCTGLFLQSFTNHLLMFISLVGSAIFNISMTWSPSLILLVFLNFGRSFFCAIIDTVGNTEVVEIWSKKSGPYMQSIHLGFALGGLISPLIVKPFLSPMQISPASSVARMNMSTNNSSNITVSVITTMSSRTESTLLSQTTELIINATSSNSSHLEYSSSLNKTRIHYAYLIIAIITLITAVPFGFNVFKFGKFWKVKQTAKQEKEVPFRLKESIFPLLLMLFIYMVYCGMEDGISVYLTSFTVKYLNWTKQDGSLATFVFWLCFAFGRFLGIFMLKILNVNQMIFMDFTLLNVCSFVLLWSRSLPILVWIFYGISGFAMASVFATGFTWAETYLFKVTARICSAILVFSSAGTSLNPLFLGYMMENYSARWYLYIIFGESIACSALFLVLVLFSKSEYWQNKRKLPEDLNTDGSLE